MGSIHDSLNIFKQNFAKDFATATQNNKVAWTKVAQDFGYGSNSTTSLVSATEVASGDNSALYGIGAIAALAAAVALNKKSKKEKKIVLENFDMEQPSPKESKKQIKATLKNIMMKNEAKTLLM